MLERVPADNYKAIIKLLQSSRVKLDVEKHSWACSDTRRSGFDTTSSWSVVGTGCCSDGCGMRPFVWGAPGWHRFSTKPLEEGAWAPLGSWPRARSPLCRCQPLRMKPACVCTQRAGHTLALAQCMWQAVAFWACTGYNDIGTLVVGLCARSNATDESTIIRVLRWQCEGRHTSSWFA